MLLLTPISRAQMITFSNQDLLDYTSKNPFGRLADGRPKVPDDLIERARGLSAEEIWAGLEDKKFRNQYADGFQVLHPAQTLVGRAFTVQFMPERSDLDSVAVAKAKARGIPRLTNQTAIDMLQPGDVLTFYSDASHAGLYIGDGLMVHSSTYGVPVRVVPMNSSGPIYDARRY